jgi:hypothetical protein
MIAEALKIGALAENADSLLVLTMCMFQKGAVGKTEGAKHLGGHVNVGVA